MRVRQREPEALGRFLDRYFPYIYGLVLRLVGDVPLAEDVTQEVFVKIHRAIGSLDPQRDPSPWLTTIAYNACRDLWRSSSYRMSRVSSSFDARPELTDHLPAIERDPEQKVLAREREAIVQKAIDRLPEQQREVVMLHDYQGLTHDQIAQIIGASHAAVRKRYSRALSALGETLTEWLP
jgi:RNA polymerase sigma-70 factor (ECF subfamily)